MDAQDALRLALDAHDVRLKDRLLPSLHAVVSQKAASCGRDQARRGGKPWMWSAVLLLDVAITQPSGRIGEVLFPGGSPDLVGDAQFQECVRGALIGASVSCSECKPGTVSFPYPVAMIPFIQQP